MVFSSFFFNFLAEQTKKKMYLTMYFLSIVIFVGWFCFVFNCSVNVPNIDKLSKAHIHTHIYIYIYMQQKRLML